MPSCRIHTFFDQIMAFVFDVQPRVSPWAERPTTDLPSIFSRGPHQWYLCGPKDDVSHRCYKISFGKNHVLDIFWSLFWPKGWAAKILKSHPAPWGLLQNINPFSPKGLAQVVMHTAVAYLAKHNPWRKGSHHNYLSFLRPSPVILIQNMIWKVNPSQPQLQSNQ